MSRMIPVYEKLIQDEVSRPECLKEMLAQLVDRRLLDSSEWKFDPDEADGDIVNQEYAIGARAVDVIATFNKRRKVLIAETKWGEATNSDLEQLEGYIAVLREDREVIRRTEPSMANADLDGVIGLLVGQAFAGITSDDLRLKPGIHLFRCEFSGPQSPPAFTYVPPTILPASPTSAPPNRSRRSYLVRLRDHTADLGPELHMPSPSSHAAFSKQMIRVTAGCMSTSRTGMCGCVIAEQELCASLCVGQMRLSAAAVSTQ